MRVLIAAGGTGGHVNPALAIAEEIRRRRPDTEFLFAGRRDGMEYGLVTGAGYNFAHISVRGFQRRLSLENIGRNIAALWDLAFAGPAAGKIVRNFAPDVCIGTGGYVSGPVVRAAAKKGVPTAIHEQNAFPGVTNKLLAPMVDIVFAASRDAVDRLGAPEKTIVVGNPVRAAVFGQNAVAAKAAVGAAGRPVLLSFGGSLGAAPVNEAVAHLAKWHLENRNWLHIHATGKAGYAAFMARLAELGITPGENLQVRPYIEDMPRLLAAADLCVCRAGALTLGELAAAGRASVLVPSPYVAENHQYFNAMELVNAGAARLLEEKNLTGKSLIAMVSALMEDGPLLAAMGRKAAVLAQPACTSLIAQDVLALVEEGKKPSGK